MRNGFITIWLVTTITLVMGCASTPKPSSKQKEAPVATAVKHCNTQIISVDDNYPWSIPGYHDTLTKQSASLSITQTRGESDQFIICADCPCVTPKSATASKPTRKNVINKDKVTPPNNPKKVVIRFDPASSILSEQHQQLLTRSYRALPEQYQLTITGYTDDTTSGGTITNKSLAQQRAKSVFDFLVTLGLDEKRTTLKASPLCCYVAPNTTDSGRALNRRVEIIITSLSTNRKHP